jgi:hypothetical protein
MGGNSVEYLTKRLRDGGHAELLAAVESGELSTYGAAEAAGIVRRRPVVGGGSENQARRRAWAVLRATGKAPALEPRDSSQQQFSPAMPSNGRTTPRPSMPNLAAAIAEWEEAQRQAAKALGVSQMQVSRDLKPNVSKSETKRSTKAERRAERELEPIPLPVHSGIPCTSCTHPCAPAAVMELLNVALAARRGETGLAGSAMPRACCRQQVAHVDVRSLVG